MSRGDRAQTGVRPFDPFRDPKQVTDLIAVAFGDRLGPDGEVMLAEMRRVARWNHWSPLRWLLYRPRWSMAGLAQGFVWVEQGRVVGNVSLRRALGWGGFFIGNVAVHPDRQGQGIAGALMEAALEAISEQGGHWVGLEVRADNEVARRLYEHLGFRDVGETLHMLRPAGLPWTGNPPSHPSLRRGCSRDSAALIELVCAVAPAPQRPLLELRKEDYRPSWGRALDRWLEGRREAWWVVEEDGVIRGAVRTLHERGRRPDRMEVLMSPGVHLETLLVQRGVAGLRTAHKKMIETILPNPGESLVAALEAVGFQKLRVLVQMRLDLAQPISVRDY